jgi:methylated-DNA-protein-cysteine methyltransferase-like protein
MKPASASFAHKVYAIAAKIPKGKVATYGQIARLAGRPRAARAVGSYMAKNTDTTKCPCHRVVGASGALTGYAYGGLAIKRKKLFDEGVAFRGASVDLAKSLWQK